MSIFNQKRRTESKRGEVRTVREAVAPKPKPRLSANPSSSSSVAKPSSRKHLSASGPRPSTKSLSPHPTAESSSRKRRAGSSKSPAATPNFFDDDSGDEDEEDNWEERLDSRKRRKRAQSVEDLDRVVRHPKLWTGAEGDGSDVARLPIIHASKLAKVEEKCKPVLGLAADKVAVKLQYPGARFPERYELVWGKDKIDAVKDIMKVVSFVASIYLPDDEAEFFVNQTTGICRRLEKSKNTDDGLTFKTVLREYNERLLSLQRKGTIAKSLEAMHALPRDLVAFILDQIYDRTVAPQIELLSKYENGSDNVYGELLHPFVSDILERTKMTSKKVFVDLGSGVGNAVIHAALEIGCESWGCEVMENACNMADAQKKEFLARCHLWGIAAGDVHLERGDFRTNDKILETLKRADVVLVNNQVFTSQLNDNLVSMFLDLKPGCKIVSLKTFVHENKLAENDVAASILDVEHLTYPEDYVSWTSAGGTYCISTRRGN